MSPLSLTLAQAQQQSRALYRRILRTSRPLAPDTREYYRRIARSTQARFPAVHVGCLLPLSDGCSSQQATDRSYLAAAQGFGRHRDETDPARIQDIIGRVEQDMHWVRRKHNL